MRANRLLAPHDPKLNDIRWLVGESLRRTHQRARLDQLRAVAPDRLGSTGFGPRPGLPQSDVALHARDKLRDAEDRVGPHAWPIVTRIVIEGAGVRDCRGFVPELATPWRADAVVSDRLRVGARHDRRAHGGHAEAGEAKGLTAPRRDLNRETTNPQQERKPDDFQHRRHDLRRRHEPGRLRAASPGSRATSRLSARSRTSSGAGSRRSRTSPRARRSATSRTGEFIKIMCVRNG